VDYDLFKVAVGHRTLAAAVVRGHEAAHRRTALETAIVPMPIVVAEPGPCGARPRWRRVGDTPLAQQGLNEAFRLPVGPLRIGASPDMAQLGALTGRGEDVRGPSREWEADA
jgi:hypothetical protein